MLLFLFHSAVLVAKPNRRLCKESQLVGQDRLVLCFIKTFPANGRDYRSLKILTTCNQLQQEGRNIREFLLSNL